MMDFSATSERLGTSLLSKPDAGSVGSVAQNCARNGSAACCGECHPSTKSVFWLGAFWNAAASVARRRFGSVETPLQSLGGTTGSQRRRRFAVPAHSMECEPPNYRNVQSPKWQQVLT